MNPPIVRSLVLLLVVLGAPAAAAQTPSVSIRTTSIQKTEMPSKLPVYGVVTADTRKAVNINFARAGEIARLMVTEGRSVRRGEPLLSFHTDPAAALVYEKAVQEADFARQEVRRTQTMLSQGLATQSQLDGARKALADAQAAVQTQRKLGKGKVDERVTAPFDGIVTRLKVHPGDRVRAGAMVMQLTRSGYLLADLGVEPEDAHKVAVGQTVDITSVFNNHQKAEGKIIAVHGIINPSTRLVDVIVEISAGQSDHFIPGMQVIGRIGLGDHQYWTVPRSAVLRDDQGAYIFQVEKGNARRVDVTVEQETDQQTAISGGFNPVLKVVVRGNYELHDGMAVREGNP